GRGLVAEKYTDHCDFEEEKTSKTIPLGYSSYSGIGYGDLKRDDWPPQRFAGKMNLLCALWPHGRVESGESVSIQEDSDPEFLKSVLPEANSARSALDPDPHVGSGDDVRNRLPPSRRLLRGDLSVMSSGHCANSGGRSCMVGPSADRHRG